MLLGMIVLLNVGILCFVLGWLLWKKQKISLVNAGHTRNVREADVSAYTKRMGLGLITIGAGCVLAGTVALGLEELLGRIGLAVGFSVGFALIITAQKKYNGGRIIS